MTAGADGSIRTYHCALCVPIPELISIGQERLKASGH